MIVVPLDAKLSERVLKSASTLTFAVAIDPSPAGETYSPPSFPLKLAAPIVGTADAGVAEPNEIGEIVW